MYLWAQRYPSAGVYVLWVTSVVANRIDEDCNWSCIMGGLNYIYYTSTDRRIQIKDTTKPETQAIKDKRSPVNG